MGVYLVLCPCYLRCSDSVSYTHLVKNQLDNLYQQQAAAKEEIGKPFPFEDDLRVKSARLVELDLSLIHISPTRKAGARNMPS